MIVLLLLIGFQEWWVLSIAAIITGIILVSNLTSGRPLSISLAHSRIEVVYLGSRGRIDTIHLKDYDAFTTVSVGDTKRNPERWFLVFRPRRRFAGSAIIPLPYDLNFAVQVVERLERTAPFVEEGAFPRREQFLANAYQALGLR